MAAVATYLNQPQAKLPAGVTPTSGIARGWAAGNTAYQAAVNGTPNPNMPKSSYTSTPPKTPAPTPQAPAPTAPRPNPTQPPPNTGYTPMPNWTPTPFGSTPYATPPPAPNAPSPTGGINGLLNPQGGANIWNPQNFVSNDGPIPNWLSQVVPVAQLQQNAYQYSNDAQRAAYQNDRDYLSQRQNDIFQQQLATQQQNAAQWQANQAASQFQQQFGQQKTTDQWAHELSQQQLADQINQTRNTGQYQQGLVSNQATANANQLQVGLGQNAAQRYQADQSRIAQLGQANIYAGAQNYGADQQLAGQRYQADQTLAGAGLYSDAQRYGAQQQYAGTKYTADTDYRAAQLNNQYLMQQLAQQQQMQQLQLANNLQVANTQAFGRSQAPQANWARSWS